METIFNHNVTTDEIKIINLLNFEREIEDKINYENSINDESRYTDLYRLNFLRGDPQTAEKYFHKIKVQALN